MDMALSILLELKRTLVMISSLMSISDAMRYPAHRDELDIAWHAAVDRYFPDRF
jgi:hypothetical protein